MSNTPHAAERMFQIRETDLAALERELPRLLDCAYGHLDNHQRVKWRAVQAIIVNVRWNYGPPSEVITIPFNDETANPQEGPD